MKKFLCSAFIAALLATGFCASPAFAQTATSTKALIQQLEAQIKALQARLLELEAELGVKPAVPMFEEVGTSTTSAMEFPIFDRVLSKGMRGDDVRNLQQFLAGFPDFYPQGLITGYYGPFTEKAVQRFQEKYGIVSFGTHDTTGYGRLGPRTLARVNELLKEEAGRSGIIPHGLLTAPGIQKKIATTTAEFPPSLLGSIATTTPSTPTSTSSGTIPAVPAQPIGQTGTTTIPATPATPVVSPPPTGGLPPPPSQTPPPPPTTATTTPPAAQPPPPPPPPLSQTSPPPPATATTTPPALPPPPPSSMDFALVYKTPQVTVAQGGTATIIIDVVPISGVPYPSWAYLDRFQIEGGTNRLSWGGGGTESCPIPCSIERAMYIRSDAAPGNYTITGLVSNKIYPLSWPSGEAIIKNLSVPLTIISSSTTSLSDTSSLLASVLHSLGIALDDLQKQIQKLVR